MKNEKAFTLIELLVVVTLIGILSAIAIPQYALYKTRSFDAGAISDLKTAAEGQEAYYIDNNAYFSCVNDGCLETAGGLPGFMQRSPTVSMNMNGINAGSPLFLGLAFSDNGSDVFIYDSSSGGITN